MQLIKTLWLVIAIGLAGIYSANANDLLQQAWEALEQSDRAKARELLEEARKQKATKVEATIGLILLNDAEGKPNTVETFLEIYDSFDDPSAYLYALWFSDAVFNDYSKKSKEQLTLLKKIFKDSRINESLKASAHYVYGMHYMRSNDLKAAHEEWDAVHSLKKWQMTGPFDNTSNSGFYKEYPPITNPQPDATFTSKTNAEIQWFVPKYPQKDPWNAPRYHFDENEAVVFAQTFVQSETEREVVLAVGGAGTIKVWVNDRLMVAQEKEQTTELDLYKVPARLVAGNNRILVQLGYTKATTYSNYIVRLLEPNGAPIEALTGSTTYAPYTKDEGASPDVPDHFAEAFFKKKLENDPNNLISNLMLARVYTRKDDHNATLRILENLHEVYPNNAIVNTYLLNNYINLEDRTQILKQVDAIRAVDESLTYIAMYDFDVSLENKDYEAAAEHLETIGNILGKNTQDYYNKKMELLSAKREYKALIELVAQAFDQYPEDVYYLSLTFNIMKSMGVDDSQRIKLLEGFLKDNYNNKVENLLLEMYNDKNDVPNMMKIMEERHERFPEEQSFTRGLANLCFRLNRFEDALAYLNKGIENSPYDASYWNDKAIVLKELKRTQEAIGAFRNAVSYNPNLFRARESIRELEGKQTFLSFFQKEDAYELIDAALQVPLDSENNSEYIFDENNYVIFEEGGSMEYHLLAVKINTEYGLRNWQEASIGTSSNQSLLVEKAETVKKDGQKIPAEENYNDLVFPNLEVGDAVFIVYRITNYSGGKLSKEFWTDHVFNAFVPVQNAKLRLFVPENYPLRIENINVEESPTVRQLEDFEVREWSYSNLAKAPDEPYMPSLAEVGKRLSFSSLDSWKAIADWYSDLTLPLAQDNYNLAQVYDQIFEGKTFNTEMEKAQAIYEYIQRQIRYSYVSFRQSGYIPQKPYVTVSTQLGDCKDFSMLYYALAKKAGIDVNLVLVSTRENGETTLRVPTIGFDHCIVKINLPNQTIYQELTDDKLPFGVVPTSLAMAQALEIPNAPDNNVGNDLIQITMPSRLQSERRSSSTITIEDGALQIRTNFKAVGAEAARFRHHFEGLNEKKVKEEIASLMGRALTNPSKVENYTLDEVIANEDTFNINAQLQAEGEVIKIGGLKAVKLLFTDQIFTTDVFKEEDRAFPVLYWNYEPCQLYDAELVYEIEGDQTFEELPADFAIQSFFMDYSLSFEKISDKKVKVIRKVTIDNNTIPAEKYTEFRDVMKKILSAEDIYLAYK